LTEQDLRKLLADVESGAVRLEPQRHPQQVYCGSIEYRASNGWKLTVFILANTFDFLEAVQSPDGQSLSLADLEKMPPLKDYEPPPGVAWKRYGLPGWCTFRCVRCEQEVLRFSEFVQRNDGTHVCKRCGAA
jgi:hypothetical protein